MVRIISPNQANQDLKNCKITIQSIVRELDEWPDYSKNALDDLIAKNLPEYQGQNRELIRGYLGKLSEKTKKDNSQKKKGIKDIISYIASRIWKGFNIILGFLGYLIISLLVILIVEEQNLIEPKQKTLSAILILLLMAYMIYLIFFSQIKFKDFWVVIVSTFINTVKKIWK